MQTMSRADVQGLDNEVLLQWLSFLGRFHAEDIGLHQNGDGNWVMGDIRPRIEDVEDELVKRGLDQNPNSETDSHKH